MNTIMHMWPASIQIPQDILDFSKVFKNAGFDLFVVGGAVRDAILGKEPKDWDLATNALPDDVERIMQKNGYTTLPTGKAFGIINVFTFAGEFEIATFREDLSSGRRPDAVRFSTIEADVKRRDLTINALFLNLDTKNIVDLVGGIDDLRNQNVRTVGFPADRFAEDRLRIMRAVRFAGNFGKLPSPAIDACLLQNSELTGVSAERIRDEFLKALVTCKSVIFYLNLLKRYNLFPKMFPNLIVSDDFIDTNNVAVLLSRMLRNNKQQELDTVLRSLKYSLDEIRDIKWICSFTTSLTPESAPVLKKQQKMTDSAVYGASLFYKMDARLVDAFLRYNLSVTGPDVVAKYGDQIKGKEFGIKMHEMEVEKFKELLNQG